MRHEVAKSGADAGLCCSRKLKPYVTLHHFVHPQWFEDLGAFNKQENIKYFVDFCCLAYRQALLPFVPALPQMYCVWQLQVLTRLAEAHCWLA